VYSSVHFLLQQGTHVAASILVPTVRFCKLSVTAGNWPLVYGKQSTLYNDMVLLHAGLSELVMNGEARNIAEREVVTMLNSEVLTAVLSYVCSSVRSTNCLQAFSVFPDPPLNTSTSCRFSRSGSPPAVSWSPPCSLSLRITLKRHLRWLFTSLPQCVASPSKFSFPISIFISVWPDSRHSSLSEMVLGHQILNIYLRHLLINV
jgi:hypothetical protein